MTTLWTRIFLLGSILGVTICLILVSLMVLIEGQPKPLLTVTNIKEEYVTQLAPIEQSLKSVVDRQLTAADKFELTTLRQRLLGLNVPAEAKEFHLAIVLKLNQLENLLVQSTAKSEAAIKKLQTDLRALLTERQW